MTPEFRFPGSTHLPANAPVQRPLRLIHFVADDSQAIQPAVLKLVRSTENVPELKTMLVLDKAFNNGKPRGIKDTSFKQMESWSTIGRTYEFYRFCRHYQPDAVFIHSEQNTAWCRYASLQAGTARVIHINEQLRQQIPYSIDLSHFNKADEVPLSLRIPGIIMPSGFNDQFHLQLIRALACLREKRLSPRVFLTGPGTRKAQEAAHQLGYALGLDKQLRIASHCGNLPFLLMHHQLSVIGNPDKNPMLVAQSMAAGCATLGITPANTPSLIQHGNDGILFASDSPELLAEKLEDLLQNSSYAQQLARQARLRAQENFSLPHMHKAYTDMYLAVTGT
ncbi:MAG: hypothetical protein B0W54_14315 [Cellvibrio sp. 79]|nr:MAG: hypothetical protein B0W54_14315 [Cellvibrio sp. 79]